MPPLAAGWREMGVPARQLTGWEPEAIAPRAQDVLATRVAPDDYSTAILLVTRLVRWYVWRHPNQLRCARCGSAWQRSQPRQRGEARTIEAPPDRNHVYVFLAGVDYDNWRHVSVYCQPCVVATGYPLARTAPTKHHNGRDAAHRA